MTTKFILTSLALGLQYLLLHSHKSGQSHWIWTASASVFLLMAGSYVLKRFAHKRTYLVLFSILSVAAPSAVYAICEWIESPDSLANAVAHDLLFYLTSTSIVAGGWLFAALLIWISFRSTTEANRPGLVGQSSTTPR